MLISIDGLIGACAGGILAYGAARFGRDVIPLSDEVVCTIATLLAASGAQLVGQRAGSAYAAKLSTITFVLVLLGSKDAPSETLCRPPIAVACVKSAKRGAVLRKRIVSSQS